MCSNVWNIKQMKNLWCRSRNQTYSFLKKYLQSITPEIGGHALTSAITIFRCPRPCPPISASHLVCHILYVDMKNSFQSQKWKKATGSSTIQFWFDRFWLYGDDCFKECFQLNDKFCRHYDGNNGDVGDRLI